MKDKAKKNFEINVEMVAVQISLWVMSFCDSSEICIPKESEKASATAIAIIPLTIVVALWVAESRPTIIPNVVITPEVIENLEKVYNSQNSQR